MSNATPYIEVKELTKTYPGRKAAVQDVSFSMHEGSQLGIIGETGSGKSTLLKMIAGLIQPDKGSVLFQGEKVKGPEDQLIPGHPEIAYLSQSFDLPKSQSVRSAIEWDAKVNEEALQFIYKTCRIESYLESRTDAISGGEKQRVALAKAFSMAPEVLLLDEPFSNLDRHNKNHMRRALSELQHSMNTTMIMITHDPLDVLSWAQNVMVMQRGTFIQSDSPENLYKNPQNEYVAGLLGEYSFLNYAQWKDKVSNSFHVIDDQFMLRPENIMLSNKSENGFNTKGRLIEVYYFGGYREAVIEVNGSRLIARLGEEEYKKGDDIWVGFIR